MIISILQRSTRVFYNLSYCIKIRKEKQVMLISLSVGYVEIREARSTRISYDELISQRLWQVSEELAGLI